MVILGLLLVGGGVLLIVSAVSTLELSAGQIELLGTEIGVLTLFLLGLASGVAILLGLALSSAGVKRSMRHRRERGRLTELSEKLDEVEAERRRNHDDDDRSPRI